MEILGLAGELDHPSFADLGFGPGFPLGRPEGEIDQSLLTTAAAHLKVSGPMVSPPLQYCWRNIRLLHWKILVTRRPAKIISGTSVKSSVHTGPSQLIKVGFNLFLIQFSVAEGDSVSDFMPG